MCFGFWLKPESSFSRTPPVREQGGIAFGERNVAVCVLCHSDSDRALAKKASSAKPSTLWARHSGAARFCTVQIGWPSGQSGVRRHSASSRLVRAKPALRPQGAPDEMYEGAGCRVLALMLARIARASGHAGYRMPSNHVRPCTFRGRLAVWGRPAADVRAFTRAWAMVFVLARTG